jgi:hypothetical protein
VAEFLVTYRRRLGQELGRFGVFTAQGGSTTTAICTTAFASSVLPTDNQAYVWFYVPTAVVPRLKQVTLAGLDSTTGTLTFSGDLGTAVANGTVFELSAGLPPAREGGASNLGMADQIGLNECINLALDHILIEDDSPTLTLADGQYDYAVSATWPWLDRPERLLDVRVLNAIGTTYKSTEKTWELRGGPGTRVLHFFEPFSIPSGTFSAKLVTRRPAKTRIAVSSVWGNSTVGLVNESDQAEPDVQTVIDTAKVFAYESMRNYTRGTAAERYAALYERQLAMVRQLPSYDQTNDIGGSRPSRLTGSAA